MLHLQRIRQQRVRRGRGLQGTGKGRQGVEGEGKRKASTRTGRVWFSNHTSISAKGGGGDGISQVEVSQQRCVDSTIGLRCDGGGRNRTL